MNAAFHPSQLFRDTRTGFFHRKYTLLRNGPACKIKETGVTSDVPVMVRCVQSGWEKW